MPRGLMREWAMQIPSGKQSLADWLSSFRVRSGSILVCIIQQPAIEITEIESQV